MARSPKTRDSRATDVEAALEQLPILFREALACEALHGPDEPTTLEHWARVEEQGATIHRQSRILAGKGKGG